MSSTVHVVRHGEVHNPEKILYGRQPGWTLSERGHKMAATLGDWSKSINLGALHVSPLQRAQETAAPISAAHNMKITTDERLIEAANRFDPTLGNKFISYAVWYIRKEMIEYLNNSSRTIRIPMNKSGNITKFKDEVNRLVKKEGKEISKDSYFITTNMRLFNIFGGSFISFSPYETPEIIMNSFTIESKYFDFDKIFNDAIIKVSTNNILGVDQNDNIDLGLVEINMHEEDIPND